MFDWILNIPQLSDQLLSFSLGLSPQLLFNRQYPFCVVTVNDEHTKPTFKRKRRVKYKDDISVELCLKLWFESDWYFYNINESGWFSKRLFRNKVPNNHFAKSIQKQPYADVLLNRCFAKISQQENTCVGTSPLAAFVSLVR